jgi:pimeloyl-ACP methyl ester carboxylesterase
MNIERKIAKLRDVDLFYLDTKTEGKPVILCLHGRWGRAETWADFIEHYGDQFRVIAPDQRGHGLSSKPTHARYTPKEMADDIIQLLDVLHINSAIVVGHSMGGAVAGYLAALYPQYVKAVAILDKSAAGPAQESPLPTDISRLEDPATKDWPMPFPTLHSTIKFIRCASASELEYQYMMNSLTETVDGYQMMFSPQAMAINVATYTDWFSLLPEIKCRTLLIRSGSHEAIPDNEFAKMQSLLSHCIAFEMTEPDHNVHLAGKAEFYRYFDEFLKDV